MSPTALVPSRYLTFGTGSYLHRSGQTVRPVYHTATATALLLDPATVDSLRGVRDLDTLDAAARTRLAELGLLVPAGTDEAAAVIEKGRTAARDDRRRQFVVMPTAYCNMGCDYCGQEHQRGPAITPGTHRAALIARAEKAMESGRYDSVSIRWFGGEPLMGFAVMRALSARFIADAQRHGVAYEGLLVTNGALLDARKLRTLHLECRIAHVEVTIDGPAETHEVSRPLKSGQRSFDRITGALRAALADPDLQGLRMSVRTNVGAHNAGQAREFAAAMRDAGLAHPRVTFYPAPIHSWGNDVSAIAVDRSAAARVELAWFDAYLEAGLTCTPLPVRTKPVVCTAATLHSEVVAPDGKVYSCTEQPLVPGFTDRHVATLTELAPDELRPAGEFDDWYDALAANETGCRGCVLLPVCGGACPKLWREGKPPCPPMKSNLRDRLDVFARSLGLTAA